MMLCPGETQVCGSDIDTIDIFAFISFAYNVPLKWFYCEMTCLN